MNRIRVLFLLIILLGVILTGCGDGSSPAVQSVENYLQALVAKDEALMTSYLCPEFEMEAFIEFDSFSLVQTSLEGLSCSATGEDGDAVQVVCQGSIEATYGNELRSFDLSERTYSVVESKGDWLVCGYSK